MRYDSVLSASPILAEALAGTIVVPFHQQNYSRRQHIDALELLKQDHQRVKEFFEQCEGSEDKKSTSKSSRRLNPSSRCMPHREKNFLSGNGRTQRLRDMVLESLEEHK